MTRRKTGPKPKPRGEVKRPLALVSADRAETAELRAWAARERRPLAVLLREAGLEAAGAGTAALV